jgi:hypothetical protein
MEAPTEESQRIASKVIEPPQAGTDTVSNGKAEIAHVRSSLKARFVNRSDRPRTSSRSPCFKSRDFMARLGAGHTTVRSGFGAR